MNAERYVMDKRGALRCVLCAFTRGVHGTAAAAIDGGFAEAKNAIF